MKYVPRTYQVEALKQLESGADNLLFIEMGLGKTVVVLTHIAKLLKKDSTRRFLVVAPLRVVRYVWRQQADQWDHTRHLTFADASVGSEMDRRLAIRSDANIVLINYEKLAWLCDKYRVLPFYGLILDEIDKMKATGSQRFRRFRGRAHQFDMRIGMTGTPTSESLAHIWGPTFLITSQARGGGRLVSALGSSDSKFKDQYFDRHGWALKSKPGAMDQVMRRIKPYVYAARSADHLDIPELEVRDVLYDLPPKALQHYRDLELELVTFLGQEDAVSVRNRAVLVNKLQQLCSGFLYDDGSNAHWIHKVMVNTYEEMMSELQGPHVVVYGFVAEREQFKFKHVLSSKLGAQAEGKLIDAWNRGEISQLAMHPAAGGHGLNLQDSGAHHLVFLTLPWSRAMYDQTVARLHRMGQTRRVVVWRLLARNTIDQRVVDALVGKGEVQDAVFTALRAEYGAGKTVRNEVREVGQRARGALDQAGPSLDTGYSRQVVSSSRGVLLVRGVQESGKISHTTADGMGAAHP